jgi:hypothetical protein
MVRIRRRYFYFDEQAESYDEMINPPSVNYFLKLIRMKNILITELILLKLTGQK